LSKFGHVQGDEERQETLSQDL